MILPYKQPRPEHDRNVNIAQAVALTPITFVVDLVVDPIGYLVWTSGAAESHPSEAARPTTGPVAR